MKRGKKSPYSMDANLLHISYEGGNLEDPWSEAEEDMWRWTVAPEQAPDQPTYLTLSYEKGDIVAIDGVCHRQRSLNTSIKLRALMVSVDWIL